MFILGFLPKNHPVCQVCSIIVVGSMLSKTPGAREPLSCFAYSRLACSLVKTIGSLPIFPDLAATVQIQGAHPSPRSTLAVNSAIPGGWIDLTRRGFDLLATTYHFLFNNGSEYLTQ